MPGEAHPTLVITKCCSLFEFGSVKPIKLGMTVDDFNHAQNQIKKKIRRFEAVCDSAIEKATGDTESSKIAKEEGKLDILLSSLEKNFENKHSKEIRRFTSFDDLNKYLKQIAGQQTTEQRILAATNELDSLTRRLSDNEPFCLFVERLKNLAKDIDDDQNVQSYIVKRRFSLNLTESQKSFLLDHGKSEADVEEKAQFLDSKEKHLKNSNINAISTNSEVMSEIKALRGLVESMFIKKVVQDEEVEINRIQANKTKSAKPERSSQLPTHLKSAAENVSRKRSYPSHWILNERTGRPISCGSCGEYGHYSKICPETCTATCYNCGKVGHLQSVCQEPKTAKNSE